jgi:hypothetical protein
MGKITFSNIDGYYIPHEDFIDYHKKGLLQLGVVNDLAAKLVDSKNPALKPKGTACAAFNFWSWVAVGVFGVSIYFSFVKNWWWFIVGFIAMQVIWKANKKGNAENYLDAAFNDPSFYDNVQSINGWIYQTEEQYLNEFEKYKK